MRASASDFVFSLSFLQIIIIRQSQKSKIKNKSRQRVNERQIKILNSKFMLISIHNKQTLIKFVQIYFNTPKKINITAFSLSARLHLFTNANANEYQKCRKKTHKNCGFPSCFWCLHELLSNWIERQKWKTRSFYRFQ